MAYASPGLIEFRLYYEISPITLTGGSLNNFPTGALPILALTQPDIYGGGILAAGLDAPEFDDYFAHFYPLPSSTLIDNQYGEYPFANQMVAANAAIVQPLKFSMLMICPPSTNGAGYFTKAAILSNMQAQLQAHVLAGGLFTVALPSTVYTDCVLLRVEDVSPVVSAQTPPGIEWRWDFEQPLVTLQAAQQAYNTQYSKMASDTQYDPTTGAAGAQTGVGATGQTPFTVPTSQSSPASSVSGPSSGSPIEQPNAGSAPATGGQPPLGFRIAPNQ